MGLVEDLVTWLDSQSTALAAGTNLFAYASPDVDRPVVFLADENGGPPTRTYSNLWPKAENPAIWVTSRSTQAAQGSFPSPLGARRLSQIVWRALETLNDTTIPSTGSRRIWRADAIGSPGWAGRDDLGRGHHVQVFDVTATPSSSDYA